MFCRWGPTFHPPDSTSPEGMTSPLKEILGFNYLNLCKNWIFHVIWPCRPFDDLILIKGHKYCINKKEKLSLFHHSLITQACGLKFAPFSRVIG
jgi:hypothetical protein